MPFLVSNTAYLMTNNSGACCISDNVIHEFCMIATSVDQDLDQTTLPGFEPGFKLSQCKDRCSNDPFCKGFSKFSVSYINIDGCILYTTYNHSTICTHNLDGDKGSTIAVGPLDPNTVCTLHQDTSEHDYYEGCHIKIKDVKGKYCIHAERIQYSRSI